MNSSHFNQRGEVHMVDVSAKAVMTRTATAEALLRVNITTATAIRSGGTKKGDVLQVARLAAIQGIKQTANLIPLCHPLAIEGVEVQFEWADETTLRTLVHVRTSGKTGVEMEALTGASVAALTVYDMCKSIQRDIVLGPIRLLEKTKCLAED